MQCIPFKVRELLLEPKRDKAWKFTCKMRKDFNHNSPGRIWWVNTKTKVKTTIHDTAVDTDCPPPQGLHVFAPLDSPENLQKVIRDFQRLYQEEEICRTLPDYDQSPYQNIHLLFTGNDPEDVKMTYRQVLDVLEQRTPEAAKLITHFSDKVKKLLGISQQYLEAHSYLWIIRYLPHSGFVSHIDNVVRVGGTAGPVFTMSLGSSVTEDKHMDIFPVIEHWRKPLRISTPIGSVILMDGESRVEWSHGIPSGDPTERWTIMLKFNQISNVKVKHSAMLNLDIFTSKLRLHDTSEEESADDRVGIDIDRVWDALSEIFADLKDSQRAVPASENHALSSY
jgi:alkylated DNA repair dioxygenase AlkB